MSLPIGTCVMPPRLDGGTRFAIDLTDENLAMIPMQFRRVIEATRRVRSREEARADAAEGGRTAYLPLPARDELGCGVLTSAKHSGERASRVTFFVEDVVFIELDLEHAARAGYSGRCTIDLKARYLHSAIDQRALVGEWLRRLHWMLTGESVAHDGLHGAGWSTINMEMCSDLVGVQWQRSDAGNFNTPSSRMVQGDEGKYKVRHATHGADPFFAETVSIGTRASNVSLCLYDKLTQLEDCKGGDTSAYATIWRAHGWDDEQSIARVEFRLRSRGLTWMDPDSGELHDLRDPMVAADPDVLAKTFGMQAQRVRLIDPGSATRRKRCRTDERWLAVQRVADAPPGRMIQYREAQADAHDAAVERSGRAMMRNAERFAALHNTALDSDVGYESIIAAAVRDADRRMVDDEVVDTIDEARSRRRATMSRYGTTYRGLRLAYMRAEIETARKSIERDLEAGHSGEGLRDRTRNVDDES